jgi:hypothetical protein
VAWGHPIVFVADMLLLFAVYSLWLARKKRQRRLPSIHTGDAHQSLQPTGLTLRARLGAERRRSVTRYDEIE